MGNPQHLAARYRPETFDEVVGQAHAVGSLRGMIMRNRVPPVILFQGPHSTGKTTLARLMAMYVNCQDPGDDGNACGECPSCKLMVKVIKGLSVHPDVEEMNAALHGGIDSIRNLETLALQHPRFLKRVFIMDEAHQISGPAFQGSLKLFEEPPSGTMYILCTTNPEKLPPAILDRCHAFQLHPLEVDEVARRLYEVALKEKFKPGSKKILQRLCKEIAASSGGHLRGALGLLDNIHSYTLSIKGKPDWKKMLPKIMAETPELAPYAVIQKYMQGLFEERRSLPFLAIDQVTNPDYFLAKVLESWQLIVGGWIDADSLVDNGKLWMLRGVDAPSVEAGRTILEESDDVSEILNIYTDAMERIKSYTTDSKSVLQAATLRVIRIIARWKE